MNVRTSDRCPVSKIVATGTIATNRSVCGMRNYDYEDEVVISEHSFTGVTTSIYPNPNHGSSVNLKVDGMEGELHVRITAAIGRMVYSNR